MKLIHVLKASALTMALVSPGIYAQDSSPNVQNKNLQKEEIQKIVHDYLVSNPEVLLEASQALQQKQQQAMQNQAQAAIKANGKTLFVDALTTTGNAKGDVTLVEFFDYQCIHCKKMAPLMAQLLKNNPNLRIIYKEFPIFGKGSETASRAALAAAMQGKYEAMHTALLKTEKPLTDELVMEAAKNAGLDMTKLKTDMDSSTVKDALAANRNLAEKMRLMGTPAFVIAATPAGQYKENTEAVFIPGAASLENLQDVIKKAS